MPRPAAIFDRDYAVKRYLAGASTYELANEFRCRRGTIASAIREAIGATRMDSKPIESDDLIRRYRAGESVLSLARSLGVQRGRIGNELAKAGIPLRGNAEAGRLTWGRLKGDRAAVERQCSGAWAAVTGSIRPLSARVAGAKTRHARVTHVGRCEADLAALLAYSGLGHVSQQFAIGPYNLDIALDEILIAIEVQMTSLTPSHASTRRERIEYILDQGWSCLMLVSQRTFDLPLMAEKCIAFAKVARRDPSGQGQYGMIGREGQSMTPKRYDPPRRTRVDGF